MYMEKLNHFFPAPAVRKLDRCRYKVPEEDDHRDELVALKREIMYVVRTFPFLLPLKTEK